MIIRLEKDTEQRQTEELTREAFWNIYRPGCVEHYILHRFRSHPDFVRELNCVIEDNGKIVSHIMYSRGKIETDTGESIPIMIFGPVSVLPEYQGRGYGSALIRRTLDMAAEIGCGAVAITGDPAYYRRFGFVSGSSLGVYYNGLPRDEESPFFMIKELKEGFLKGITGIYKAPEGYSFTEEEVNAFDARFAPKEKKQPIHPLP